MTVWVVVERFGGFERALICMNEDGDAMLFDNQADAAGWAKENCQDGLPVQIGDAE